MSVRRDRKFYTSLALHEAVAEHLAETPVYVTVSSSTRSEPRARSCNRTE